MFVYVINKPNVDEYKKVHMMKGSGEMSIW